MSDSYISEQLASLQARQIGLLKSMTHLPSTRPHDNLLVNVALVRKSVCACLCMCVCLCVCVCMVVRVLGLDGLYYFCLTTVICLSVTPEDGPGVTALYWSKDCSAQTLSNSREWEKERHLSRFSMQIALLCVASVSFACQPSTGFGFPYIRVYSLGGIHARINVSCF